MVDRGTLLSFKPDFKETKEYIQSPYLDNRLGVYVALQLAETLENGAIVFSTYEEHGGNSVGVCAKYLMNNYDVFKALIAEESGIKYQLEVESAGGSDGSVLQKSDLPIDWCFIGAPEDNVHTPKEKVYKKDIQSMIDLYQVLLQQL